MAHMTKLSGRPCTAPLYRSGTRVQLRHGRRLGRVTPERPVFKPGWGWTYRVRLDGTLSPIWVAEHALRLPELPPLAGNVVALRPALALAGPEAT